MIQTEWLVYDFLLILYVKISSIDVLPSKNQALCEYCTLVSIANTLISVFPF